jgi:hypothetical protein
MNGPIIVALLIIFASTCIYFGFKKRKFAENNRPQRTKQFLLNSTMSSDREFGKCELVVGKIVRVKLENKSTKALILTVDHSLVEVMVLNDDNKELLVDKAAVCDLEPFEAEDAVDNKSGGTILSTSEILENLKSEARVLFLKSDFETANLWYNKVLKHFSFSSMESLNSGSSVIVKLDNHLHVATIEGVKTEQKLLISLTDTNKTAIRDDSDDEGIIVVSTKAIVVIVPVVMEECSLLASILLNQARCCLSLNMREQAIWKTTCALKLFSTVSEQPQPDWCHSNCCTAYYLRAKAHAVSSSPTSLLKAIRDCQRALDINPSQKEVSRFIKTLEKRQAVLLKADRNLARQIGAWTETAMEKSANNMRS